MTIDLQLLLLAAVAALVASTVLLRERIVAVIGPVAFYDMVRLSRRTRTPATNWPPRAGACR